MITDDRYVFTNAAINRNDFVSVNINTTHDTGFGKVHETETLLVDGLEFSYKAVKTDPTVTNPTYSLVKVTISGIKVDSITRQVINAKYKRSFYTFGFTSYLNAFKLEDLNKVT